jgi:hypothetical protein
MKCTKDSIMNSKPLCLLLPALASQLIKPSTLIVSWFCFCGFSFFDNVGVKVKKSSLPLKDTHSLMFIVK